MTASAERFEAAWREACANHENMADAMGRLLDEQGARLARVEALADEWLQYARDAAELGLDAPWMTWGSAAQRVRAALAPEAEGATS